MDSVSVRRCSVEGCEKEVRARGFCFRHYERFMKHGTTDLISYVPKPKASCEAPGCSKPVLALGLCSKHYQRFKIRGSTDLPVKEKVVIPCCVDGCTKPSFTRGYCKTHYQRLIRNGTVELRRPSAEERFLANIDATGPAHPTLGTPCWIWQACTNGDGYGMFMGGGRRQEGAHRFSYKHFRGEIPKHLEVDHICNTPLCVNPNHLQLLTHKQNVMRGSSPSAKYARRTHCSQGHSLDPASGNCRIEKDGRRRCIACVKEQGRRYHRQKRERSNLV